GHNATLAIGGVWRYDIVAACVAPSTGPTHRQDSQPMNTTARPRSLAGLVLTLLVATNAAAQAPTFQHHVLPMLEAKCIACHGGKATKGKLDLRTLASVLKGGKSGPVVQAGNADDSLLWQRIAADEMPPTGQPPLTAAERELIRRWIEQGKFS